MIIKIRKTEISYYSCHGCVYRSYTGYCNKGGPTIMGCLIKDLITGKTKSYIYIEELVGSYNLHIL